MGNIRKQLPTVNQDKDDVVFEEDDENILFQCNEEDNSFYVILRIICNNMMMKMTL